MQPQVLVSVWEGSKRGVIDVEGWMWGLKPLTSPGQARLVKLVTWKFGIQCNVVIAIFNSTVIISLNYVLWLFVSVQYHNDHFIGKSSIYRKPSSHLSAAWPAWTLFESHYFQICDVHWNSKLRFLCFHFVVGNLAVMANLAETKAVIKHLPVGNCWFESPQNPNA